MNENLKLFLQKVAADKEIQAKMQSFDDIDEAYKYAVTVQDGFTKEEFEELMTKLSKATSESDEISDADLSRVAGGMTTTDEAGLIGSLTTVASVAALSLSLSAM